MQRCRYNQQKVIDLAEEFEPIAAFVSNATRALAESEARLKLAQKAGKIGLWEWDVETDQTWWSNELYEILGVPADDGNEPVAHYTKRLHPDDLKMVLSEMSAARDEKRGFDIEFRIIKADGTERWMVGRGNAVTNETGRVIQMTGVNIDITDRKQIEKDLSDLNATLESRVEQQSVERDRLWSLSQDLLLSADYEGNLIKANPALIRLLGGKMPSLFDAVHPNERTYVRSILGNLKATGNPGKLQASTMDADGIWRQIAWSITPDPSGDCFFAVGRDITETVSTQQRIRDAEARMAQVQRMETLGQLASGVAHDFNNLLVPIFGVLDMLQRRPQGDPDFDKLIKGASKAAMNARNMVRQILKFSQAQQINPERVDISRLIPAMADLLQHTLPASVELNLTADQPLPPVMVNATQLELAVLNLAINARDAMPEGGQLTISAKASDKHKDGVMISVTDTGHGMDTATIARASEAFFTTKGPGKGTGLGLFMAKRLTQQVGGSFEIISAVGTGTTISLDLPGAKSRPLKRPVKQGPDPKRPDSGADNSG
jgi:PAS domain S-box-containing protein